MSEWQPIETAPKDGTSILLYTPTGICEGFWGDGNDNESGWFQDVIIAEYGHLTSFYFEPTHWMHPPVSPSQTNSQTKSQP